MTRPAASPRTRRVYPAYQHRATDADRGPLPWLLAREAHGFREGAAVARRALDCLLTRGRASEVPVVLATRPADALPERRSRRQICWSSIASAADRYRAVTGGEAATWWGSVGEQLPTEAGAALIIYGAIERGRVV